MNKYEIHIARQAKEQLNEIADYIAYDLLSPDAAYNTINKIRKEIENLSEMPERIKLTSDEPWRKHGIRQMRVNNYYIYFSIDKEKAIVNILAVIYVSRDQVMQLNKTDIEK